MPTYQIKVNGAQKTVDVSADTPVLWVLRDHLDLVGTKYGCGIGQCGACTIHVDGVAMRSCSMTMGQLEGKSVTTIEGLSEDGSHPVQIAWKEVDVPQCGYCQAGQIMTASAFLESNPNPTEEDIKNAMHGNICRCAAYNRIYRAVEKAAENMG
ncbi:MAG: (2Fe-2S)-binding protein [Muricauda sp.]|uniref:(2Fe-2S)-binding protein n=1 Tax=Flagellimonas lutaonensis TaxID=516051 RepID=UPI0005F87A42|nr:MULTISPECIES: (2Fe-2S)-binding protein [Allomuricauda]MAU27229.1 (2Fe-2S)-binding protein [Allomuricauda sp.]MBC29950.1 (2Fe-2S)-binding protein [Allomuricauda sp.]|tara:strand:+ start:71286 stop:71747 length:462 start_codon:yes stop_codon:yes gene_type:complete